MEKKIAAAIISLALGTVLCAKQFPLTTDIDFNSVKAAIAKNGDKYAKEMLKGIKTALKTKPDDKHIIAKVITKNGKEEYYTFDELKQKLAKEPKRAAKIRKGNDPEVTFPEEMIPNCIIDFAKPNTHTYCDLAFVANAHLASFEFPIYLNNEIIAYLPMPNRLALEDVITFLNEYIDTHPDETLYVIFQYDHSILTSEDITEYAMSHKIVRQSKYNPDYYLLIPGKYSIVSKITAKSGNIYEYTFNFELSYINDDKGTFDNVGIKNADVSKTEIKYYNNALHINNMENSGEYFVYTVDAKLVQSGKINAGDNEIGINLRSGAYVAKVQIGGKKPQIIKFAVAR
jgi:hypothetical protein